MSKPRIGLTTYRQRAQSGIWDTEMAFIPSFYLDAVSNAGGLPVLLPPQELSDEEAATLLEGLDGLIATGGRDADPTSYGQVPHELTDEPDKLRDITESQLIRTAIDKDFPFLGICRGAQLLNIVQGGSLIQHLPDEIGTTKYQISKGVFTPVPVEISEGSKLHEIVGGSVFDAMMYHHQAILELGDDLVISARSEDGVVEAIEMPNRRFVIAVQWHPEQNLKDLRIFRAFIEETESRRSAI